MTVKISRNVLAVLAAALMCGGVAWWKLPAASAQTTNPCQRQDDKVAQSILAGKPCRGDRDCDGLSNCAEKRVLGTDKKNPDTDGDGIDDGDEIADGTDPLDNDSDDDGLDDGEEKALGTDPNDSDTDNDGKLDGAADETDPADELEARIEGDVTALTCPSDTENGSITVLCLDITLTPDTDFDGADTCANLEARIANPDIGGAHVKVDVDASECGSPVATNVKLEDADNDGIPDDVDDDDDNDGTPDDEDPDDDGDGIPDDQEGDDDQPTPSPSGAFIVMTSSALD